MSSTTFDSHFFIKKLQEKGFPEPQAETLVQVMRELQDVTLKDTVRPQALEEKVSKKEMDSQFALLRQDMAELRKELELLRKDTEVGLERTKNEVFKWMLPLFLGQYALLIGLFTTLILKH